jgi:uncharacterized protein YdeI (BOF family)
LLEVKKKMSLIPVEGDNYLFRDVSTNAIVNTNQSEYANYLARKKVQEKEKNRIDCMERDLNSIKGDLNEIKTLLRSLSHGS